MNLFGHLLCLLTDNILLCNRFIHRSNCRVMEGLKVPRDVMLIVGVPTGKLGKEGKVVWGSDIVGP